jgi:hypothetical protein
MMRFLRALLALGALVAPSLAWGQGAIQGGPGTAGHVPMYVGPAGNQTFLEDSGPAGGGGQGAGLSELLIAARGTGLPPFIGQSTGPFGANACNYDGPITSAAGYHFLCWSANAAGNTGLIAFGAAGGAASLPLNINVNGTAYTFPPAIVIGSTVVTGGTNGDCLIVLAGVVNNMVCGGGGGITIGGTTITAGTNGNILYVNSGVLGNLGTTGTGTVVLSTNPTITGSFTATGLVTNADLANATMTINGVVCTLGSSCTHPTAANTLTGTTLANNVVASSLTSLGTITTGIWNGTQVAVAFGGTNCLAASGTCLDNITGFSSTGLLIRTGAGTYAFDTITAGSGITVTNGSGVAGNPTVALSTIAADNILGNPTAGIAAPIAMPLLSCAGAGQALTYNTSSHAIGCATISGSGTVSSGTGGQIAWYPASTNVVGGNVNANISNGTLTLGVASTTLGSLILEGSTSGAATITPQATAGTPTLTIGTTSGTIAAAAAAPLAISATTGTVSVTGVAGQVLGGAGPAFTAAPTLGAVGVATGQVKLAGTTSGTVTFSVADAAGTWTAKLPTSAGTAGQFMETDGSGNMTWANPAGGGTVNSGTAGQMTYYASSSAAVSGNPNANISAGALTLGQANTTIGTLTLEGNTSGALIITPQAVAGTPTWTAGTSSGTPAVTASAPLSIASATGNLTISAIPLTSLATQANNTFLGNISGGVAAPVALTPGQVGSALCVPSRSVFLSGSAATYTTPTCNSIAATWIDIEMLGGGGGGSGSGTSPGAGGTGNNSTISTLTASGGTGGTAGAVGGAGGTVTNCDLNLTGGAGQNGAAATSSYGGNGGISALGGAGWSGNGSGGVGASTNSGSGGGGAGSGVTTPSGGGGAAGGYCRKIITAPSATYTYTVGTGGAGGTAGTSGAAGGAGAAGVLMITAHWQ